MKPSSQKIKIVHFNDGFSFGGVETNLLNLIRSMDGTRYECVVGYAADGELRAEFERLGVQLFRFAKKDHDIKSPAGIGIVFKIFIFLILKKINIVHTHSFRTQFWAGIAARLAGKKVVEHVHEFRYLDHEEFIRRRGAGVRYQYSKYFKFLSDRVIVLTRQNRDYLIKHKIQPLKHIRLLSNGLPLRETPKTIDSGQTRKSFGFEDGQKIVLTAARIVPEKNIDLVFRIAGKMVEKRQDILFIVAGNGSLFGKFSEQAKRLKNLKMIGYSSRIHDLLSVSSAYFHPSMLESFVSISILEAMRMKVPLLVSKGVGANDEFLENGKTAFLCDPFNDEGWAECLCKIIDDPVLASQMTENAYQVLVSEFDIKKITSQIESIYQELTV